MDDFTGYRIGPAVGKHVADTGDFNGDGRDDILWRNEDGSITDWLGQADGSFADNSATASQPLSLDFQIAGVGDFNGDGRSDVLLQAAEGYLETWIGSPEGALWSPLQKIFYDAVGQVQELVDIVASSSVEEGGGGGGAPQDTSGGRIMFSQLFGLQVNIDVSQLQLFSPQQEGVTATFGDAGFTLTSGAHVVAVTRSITQIGEYYVNVDGYDFVSHMLSSTSALEPGSIIVTGQASSGGSTYWAFDPSLSGISLIDGSGGSGGTVTRYVTAGASAAANGFADAHVKNKGITAADKQEYQRVHDNVARLVDYADAHPGDMINIGGSKYITLIEVMTDLIKVSWVITDDASLSGPTGAQTWPAERLLDGGSGPSSLTTFINVQTQGGIGYTQNYDNGSGLNYQLFHEIGHAIDYYSNSTHYTNEASANTTGASLQTALGIPLMSSNGILVPPSFGYNP